MSIIDYYGTRQFFGDCLRMSRIEQGISIRDIADRCGYNKSTILRIEQSAFGARIDIIHNIASELGISLIIGSLSESSKRLLKETEQSLISYSRQLPDKVNIIEQYYLSNYKCKNQIDAVSKDFGELVTRVLLNYVVDSIND